MKIVSSKECFRSKVFTVTEEKAVDPDGFEIERAIVRHPGSAVILVVDDKKRVLMVRQFRLPAEASIWEIPAGKVDAGETPLQACKRELVEETGYRAKKWKKMFSFYPSPGYVGEKMNVFLATQPEKGDACPMDDERIECKWVPALELDKQIKTGKIVDGKTIAAFLAWQRYFRA